MTNEHEIYMRRCLQLAAKGCGTVAPNPMVGSVLVYENQIIGEGWHQQYGQAHAEVNCLHSVLPQHRHLIPESTLYVSLEPCVHYGKTPPCADLIVRNAIKKVVIGCTDTFNQVNGKGIARLQAAGIEVVVGVLEKECRSLNRRFFHFHAHQRPYIILKWAQSADGWIGQQQKRTAISGPITNRLVHRWRYEEAAILVGTQTVLIDNPLLTNRFFRNKPNPVRLLIDKSLEVPLSAAIFNAEAKTFVFTQSEPPKNLAATYLQIPESADKSHFITHLLQHCHQQSIQSILVEGGAATLQSFIDAGCWDETYRITNTGLYLLNGMKAPTLSGATYIKSENYMGDRVDYFVKTEI